jgi:hypothetical protein
MLVITVLKLQLRDWRWEVSKGLGLETNSKIHIVRQNVGLVMVFNLDSHVLKPKQGWFEILWIIKDVSMKGPMEIK